MAAAYLLALHSWVSCRALYPFGLVGFRGDPSIQEGDAPKKVQHSSGREIGVNIKDFGNPCCTNEKLNGFELGGCHPFQIR